MSTKLHLAMTTSWHIIEGFLTAGNRNDIAVAEELTADIVGCDVIQDRGYDSNKNRQNLESKNNVTIIPGRKNRKTEIVYDREKYKLRGTIERFFGKIKENRRLAVRYEKDDLSFLSFIALPDFRKKMLKNGKRGYGRAIELGNDFFRRFVVPSK